MHDKNKKSIYQQVHSTITWLNERINVLKERLEENILEGTSEDLVPAFLTSLRGFRGRGASEAEGQRGFRGRGAEGQRGKNLVFELSH